MDSTIKLPIERVGEDGWREALSTFFADYEVEAKPLESSSVLGAESKLQLKFPSSLTEFYGGFGGDPEALEFRLELYPPERFHGVDDSEWSFVQSELGDLAKDHIVIGESPSGDPVTLHGQSGEIRLFSHDPLGRFTVYDSFDALVRDALLGLIIDIDGLDLGKAEEIALKKQLVGGSDIDEEIRYQKLG